MIITDIVSCVHGVDEILSHPELRSMIREKGVSDYVTMVDISVQAYLKGELEKYAPGYGFMGEEGDREKLDLTKPHWILDPIDGTTNLIHGNPSYAVSLGLCENGEIIAAVIYNPYYEETFFAERGKGAYFMRGKDPDRAERIRVSEAASLGRSVIGVGVAPYHKEWIRDNMRRIGDVLTKCQDVHRDGSAALSLAQVAMGRMDGFFEVILQPWDFAAGILLVTEAGGRVTDFYGQTIDPDHPAAIIASNGKIHEELRLTVAGM